MIEVEQILQGAGVLVTLGQVAAGRKEALFDERQQPLGDELVTRRMLIGPR